jgi:hypothetical protein
MAIKGLIKELLLLGLIISILIFYGCASSYYQYPPVTIEEIIKLSEEKMPAEQIIDKIKRSQTAYRLSADEIVEMKNAGVDSKVIDYMLRTYEDAVRREQELQDWRNWQFYYGHYYWSPYFYYPSRPYGPNWAPYPPPPYP